MSTQDEEATQPITHTRNVGWDCAIIPLREKHGADREGERGRGREGERQRAFGMEF